MGIQVIVPVSLVIMVLTVMSAGCMNTSSEKQQSVTPTPSAPAVGLYNKGFGAFINGNYSTALDYYNQALASDPKFTRVWIAKGDVLIRLNRTSEAISAYDSALALESTIPEIWNSRGEALMMLGRYTEARDSFEKALQIAPGYAIAKENKNRTLAKLN